MSRYEQEILDRVALHGTVSVASLANQLDVTDQTIRRIVKPLVARGAVKKVHGAIVAVSGAGDPPLPARLIANRAEKAEIARLVAGIIPNGASLAIDTGSTSSFVAQMLKHHDRLTVVTNSAPIASILAVTPGNSVFMAGTQLRAHDGAAFDRSAYEVLSGMAVDWAILSASMVHPRLGFLANDQHEVDMAVAMSGIAERRIFAVDHSKWVPTGTKAPLRMPVIAPGDIVVTDKKPDPAYDTLIADLDLRLPS